MPFVIFAMTLLGHVRGPKNISFAPLQKLVIVSIALLDITLLLIFALDRKTEEKIAPSRILLGLVMGLVIFCTSLSVLESRKWWKWPWKRSFMP